MFDDLFERVPASYSPYRLLLILVVVVVVVVVLCFGSFRPSQTLLLFPCSVGVAVYSYSCHTEQIAAAAAAAVYPVVGLAIFSALCWVCFHCVRTTDVVHIY